MEIVMAEKISTSHAGEAAKGFLDYWEPRRRSGVANWFHESVRAGASTAEEVLRRVDETARQRMISAVVWGSQSPEAKAAAALRDEVRRLFREHRPEAMAYAESVIEWERLPQDERDRRKDERGAYYRIEWMRSKPPSEKQISYLRFLGYSGPTPQDCAEASELIEQALAKGEPRR
jgi:hypothetical protein